MKTIRSAVIWSLRIGMLLALLAMMPDASTVKAQAPTLGEAVDNTDLVWSTGGDADWFGQISVYYYDGDAAQSGSVISGQSSWIQTTLTGPGTVSFYWQALSIFDDLTFFIDDVRMSSHFYFHHWELQIFPIPAGSHTLRWVYEPSSSGGKPAFLDKVVFIEGAGPTLGEAVDNVALVWTTGGDAGWFGQTEAYFEGSDAARSGNMPEGYNRTSWIQTTVTGPGILSFRWKVSSFFEKQYLTFAIDGVATSSCWAYEFWEPQVYPISAGSHILRWTFAPSTFHGGEMGFLDKVVFTEGAGPVLGEAVDNTALTWTTGGEAAWFGQTEVAYDGGSAAHSGNVTEDQSSWIQTTVAGTGILSFYWKGVNPFMMPDFIVTIDGVQKARYNYSNDGPWLQQIYLLPLGNHTVQWTFTPQSGAPGSAFLDKVAYVKGPTIMLQSPDGGETLYRRDFYTIKWLSTEDAGPNVRLELYRGGNYYSTILPSTENDGEYRWFIPNQMEVGMDYRVKITSVANPSVYDDSDDDFAIAVEPLAALGGFLVLDGSDDYAATPDDAELDVGDDAGESFTVEAWVNFRTFGASDIITKSAYRLYTLTDYQSPYYYRCLAGSVQLSGGVTHYLQTCHTQYSNTGFWISGWHHGALVFDETSGQVRLYLDGEEVNTTSVAGPILDSEDPLSIGVSLEGVVDEVRVSDTARYTETTYTVPVTPFLCDAHTRALWHFDEFEGATVFHDSCGTDNVLVGYYGAHTEGIPAHKIYLPCILR